ncbi:phasin family protein [Alsobacter sp. SYSU M60028]|uniref:Phasin family protein n=1 Tax=Alsobacter ponti TaxID=2962936 RepID=A0ABT1LEF5_9HYPH|nr:phasin family protein [Alsobacter ponti]MCP8939882.1 phasin family protein [Alsobacter ponti]
MFAQFEDFQKLGKDNVDVAMKSFGSTQKSVQAIATEAADFSKKAFEQTSAAAEKLVAAKTLDKAVEIQTEYLKSAYEGFVAYASKLGELYTNLAKDTVKPYETIFAKAQAAAAK